jgi:hypothetical protein
MGIGWMRTIPSTCSHSYYLLGGFDGRLDGGVVGSQRGRGVYFYIYYV